MTDKIRLVGEIKISQETEDKLNAWRAEQRLAAIEHQKKTIKEDDPFFDMYQEYWEQGYPYGGAIGGGETILLTETSMGTVIVVKSEFTGAEINITDYGEW